MVADFGNRRLLDTPELKRIRTDQANQKQKQNANQHSTEVPNYPHTAHGGRFARPRRGPSLSVGVLFGVGAHFFLLLLPIS